MTIDVGQLKSWIGRDETSEDVVTSFPARALSATLDRDDSSFLLGEPLPPLWHWLYSLPLHKQSELGPDGHAKRGGFLPPVPLPRRMWAGSRLTFPKPIRIGHSIKRTSRIADITHKEGRTGPLVFVIVRHEISNSEGLAIIDEREIVYRGHTPPGDKSVLPRTARIDAVWRRSIHPDDALLFRYSALIFNAHRIHYDRRYVTDVEGYPGLIVRGPLIATLLADLVRRKSKATMTAFRFRAVHPLFDTAD